MKYTNLTPLESIELAFWLSERGIPYSVEIEEKLNERIREEGKRLRDILQEGERK